jgi:hypothetical protein
MIGLGEERQAALDESRALDRAVRSSPRTERRLIKQAGRTRRCLIMITSAVPPAMSLASEPNCLKSCWTSLRVLGVRYSKACMMVSYLN